MKKQYLVLSTGKHLDRQTGALILVKMQHSPYLAKCLCPILSRPHTSALSVVSQTLSCIANYSATIPWFEMLPFLVKFLLYLVRAKFSRLLMAICLLLVAGCPINTCLSLVEYVCVCCVRALLDVPTGICMNHLIYLSLTVL